MFMKILKPALILTLVFPWNGNADQSANELAEQYQSENKKCEPTSSAQTCALSEYVSFIEKNSYSEYFDLISKKVKGLELKRFQSVQKNSLQELTEFSDEFRLIYYHSDSRVKALLKDSGIQPVLYRLIDNVRYQEIISGDVKDYEKYLEHGFRKSPDYRLIQDLLALKKGVGSEEYVYFKLRSKFPWQVPSYVDRSATSYAGPLILIELDLYKKVWDESKLTMTREIGSWEGRYQSNKNYEHMKTHCSNDAGHGRDLWVYELIHRNFLGKVQCLELLYDNKNPLSMQLQVENKQIFENRRLILSTVELSSGMKAERIKGTPDDLLLVNMARRNFGVLSETKQLPDKYVFENGAEIIFANLIEDINCEWVCTKFVILFKNKENQVEELGHITSAGMDPYFDLDGDEFPEFAEITQYDITIYKVYPSIESLYSLSFI